MFFAKNLCTLAAVLDMAQIVADLKALRLARPRQKDSGRQLAKEITAYLRAQADEMGIPYTKDMNFSYTKLQKVERGVRFITVQEMTAWLGVCGLSLEKYLYQHLTAADLDGIRDDKELVERFLQNLRVARRKKFMKELFAEWSYGDAQSDTDPQ